MCTGLEQGEKEINAIVNAFTIFISYTFTIFITPAFNGSRSRSHWLVIRMKTKCSLYPDLAELTTEISFSLFLSFSPLCFNFSIEETL